jgi:hypothetical protein
MSLNCLLVLFYYTLAPLFFDQKEMIDMKLNGARMVTQKKVLTF